MDDIVILDTYKDKLHKYVKEIEKFLSDNLKLSLKSNWQIFPTYKRGIDFVGYRIFYDKVLLRKSTYKKLR